jgi:hypothetical protein
MTYAQELTSPLVRPLAKRRGVVKSSLCPERVQTPGQLEGFAHMALVDFAVVAHLGNHRLDIIIRQTQIRSQSFL